MSKGHMSEARRAVGECVDTHSQLNECNANGR